MLAIIWIIYHTITINININKIKSFKDSITSDLSEEMQNDSRSKEKIIGKSIEKQNKKMAFKKNNIVSNHNQTQINLNSNLTFQKARLGVNQKLLYIKTCFQKKASNQDIFRFYPYNNLESFSLLIGSLMNENETQNPQHSQSQIKGKVIKQQDGIHLIEHVDFLKPKQNPHQEGNSSINGQLFNGVGLSIFQDGRIFQGNYHDGHSCGFCLQINAEGDLYIGSYKNGVKKGNGTFYSFGANQVYRGKWENDLPHGQGIYSTIETTYQGNFTNGLKNGFGVQKFNNGDYYAGQYVNNICQGYGQYYWQDGSIFKGDFSHGVRHGFGFWQDQNQTYFGTYRLDSKEGYGVYTWKNKKIFKGQFKQDFRQGYGQIYSIGGVTNKNKLIYKGGWQKGAKNPSFKYQTQAKAQLYYFLDRQNEFLAQIPLRKQRVGHKNCLPNGGCGHRH